jgi:hypothetical protein
MTTPGTNGVRRPIRPALTQTLSRLTRNASPWFRAIYRLHIRAGTIDVIRRVRDPRFWEALDAGRQLAEIKRAAPMIHAPNWLQCLHVLDRQSCIDSKLSPPDADLQWIFAKNRPTASAHPSAAAVVYSWRNRQVPAI